MTETTHYFGLPPNVVPTLEQLHDVVVHTRSADSESYSFTKANLHLEIGLHPDSSETEASEQFDAAEDLLCGLSRTHWRRKAEVLAAYLPVFRQPSHRSSIEFRSALLDMICDDVSALERGESGADIGRAAELFTQLLLLGNGLVGHPSFRRQEGAHWYVDGRHYCWDVTALSDGSKVSAGTYLLQVKARRNNSTPGYHRDISKINVCALLGIKYMDPQTLVASATELATEGADSATYERQLPHVRFRNRLHRKKAMQGIY